jgi:hypothetical protein
MDELIKSLHQFLDIFNTEPSLKDYLIWFIGACLLIAVAGGGLIKIADKQIGNLKYPGRILSLMLGIIGIIVFILIPTPNLTISGVFSKSAFEILTNDDYEIRLTPVDLSRKTDIGDEGFFNFYETDKITKGTYYLSIIKNGKYVVLDTPHYFDPKNREVLVLKKEDQGYKVSNEPIYDHFLEQFRRNHNKDWMKMLEALRLLSKQAAQYESVERKIKNLKSTNTILNTLVHAFVLGELKREEAIEVLLQILRNNNKVYSLFDQMRAAYYLHHYAGRIPNLQISFSMYCQKFLINCLTTEMHKDGLRDITEGVHSAASYHLGRLKIRCREVMDRLIQNSQHKNIEISSECIRVLQKITDRQDIISGANWDSWWYTNAEKYTSCSTLN